MQTKLLFVCTGNRDRSPTAEAIFRQRPNLDVKSAGTSNYADTVLTESLVRWADIIVVMESCHENYIREHYPDAIAGKTLFRLDIPDQYHFMDNALAALIKEKMKPILEQ